MRRSPENPGRFTLYLVNRSGNRPSQEGAAKHLDQALALCRRGGFRRVTLRGDTDFTQTRELDRWDDEGVRFIFGTDARQNMLKSAEALPRMAWTRLARAPKYAVQTQERQRPENVKEAKVIEREFKKLRLKSEDVAEFSYSPKACKKTYRIVVVRKNISVEKGEMRLFGEVRYFFYLTNDMAVQAAEIVFEANRRCNQENLIEQLKNGVRATAMPVDNLLSNWAYMVMTALAWTLKAWFALLLPEEGRWATQQRADRVSPAVLGPMAARVPTWVRSASGPASLLDRGHRDRDREARKARIAGRNQGATT